MNTGSEDKEKKNRVMAEISPYFSMGLQFALTILMFAAIGYWIDSGSDSRLWTVILALFGIFAGFYKFFTEIKRLTGKKNGK